MKKWKYGLLHCQKDKLFRRAINDEGWQRFRESLKGNSTELKLARLASYAFSHLERTPDQGLYSSQVPVERAIQVSNYLNALKRGGQLNIKLEVVR